MMRKPWINSLIAALLTVTLSLGLVGCGTQKLDQSPGQVFGSAQPGPASSEAEPEIPEQFDVETTPDTETDFSKYEEKAVEVPVSDGTQSGKDRYNTDPVPVGQQLPVEPGEAEIDRSTTLSCYLTISCATILDNMDDLTEGKEGLVPQNGVLLPRTKVTFSPGESVYDILNRVTKEHRIHMESSFTPMYNSAYIEGIGNLYEFDCGANSGWMYCVNGWYPNYGVSRYVPQDQDEIQFNYTCDLGRDLGEFWTE